MIYTARGTVRESQALVARSRGHLYVAARSGEKNYTGSIIWTRSCPNLGSLT